MGVVTSLHPCPLTNSLLAMAFIGRSLGSRRRVVLAGLCYGAGVTATYFAIGVAATVSAEAIGGLSQFLQSHAKQAMGPLFIVVGMAMLGMLRIPALAVGARWRSTDADGQALDGAAVASGEAVASGTRQSKAPSLTLPARSPRPTCAGAFGLGVMLALSFCPIPAAIFFGVALPRFVEMHSTLFLPAMYGLGTALPAIAFGAAAALGASAGLKATGRLDALGKWARPVTGGVFVIVGIWYCLKYIFGVGII
jgi:cytochrome c biogenesis protein CcdA